MKDSKLQNLIRAEIRRQEESIDLIASENFVSSDILHVLGSPLSNKYSEGYPGKRYYPGNIYYDEIERLAQGRALKAFKLNSKEWHVNIQPYFRLAGESSCLYGFNGTTRNAYGHEIGLRWALNPWPQSFSYRQVLEFGSVWRK